MFGEVPKLFDRNFAIGYLLPSAYFMALNIWLLYFFGLLPEKLKSEAAHLLTDPDQAKTLLAIYGVAAFGLAILMLALNYPVTRLLEGYNKKLNPFNLIAGLEKRRFQRLMARKQAVEAHRDALPSNSDAYDLLNDKVGEIEKQMVTRFPDQPGLVLPTAFGNTLRAFESHSFVMYGLDSIPSWHRLLAVVPKDYRELMDSAKAQMDFWMNGWFFSAVGLIELALFASHDPKTGMRLSAICTAIVLALLIYVFSEMAKQTAVEWGNFVKAAFDMYWPDMLKKLGFKAPTNKEEEEELWGNFSAALVYGLKAYLPERDYEALKTEKETKPKGP